MHETTALRISIAVVIITMYLLVVSVAHAGSALLYGGSGCYGTAFTNIVSSNTTTVGTGTCDSTGQVFISGVTDVDILYGDWYYGPNGFVLQGTWIYGGHDMCYTWCNGYVNTHAGY